MLPPLLGPLALGVSTPQKGANGAFFDPIVQPELELADGIQAAVPAAVASAVAEAVASSPVMFRLQHEQSADIHRESPVPEAFDNRRVTKFVVLSQARSGSTWLNTMLNAHPRILAYGEYLSPYAGIRAYVNDGWDCEPMRRLERLENASLLKECSEWHYDKKREWIAAAGNGTVAVGFKWFNNEGGWDLEWAHHQGSKCPDTICGTCSEPSVFRKYLRGNQVKIILLERAASLPHFVSAMKLQRNKTHYECADSACVQSLRAEKINVSTSRMHQWLNYTESYWSNMRQFAIDAGVERRVVTYDMLGRNPQDVMNDLFSFLGLEPAVVNTSQTVKMGATVMRESLENADEVADALRGTPYEGQVDELAGWR